MPDIHGFEVGQRIKARDPGIVVLQTSAAVTSAHDRAVALDSGADSFLVEPIEPGNWWPQHRRCCGCAGQSWNCAG